ncbi:glutamine amidotransferase [Aquisalimonas lutea]|uniref:glutamine amidotransferase n=1 Tax=Aquisalimonas lutea TaxID=1327750 RepID=UPI0025B2A868|nr:glutamine amidotransferase [Aquisalimonas lutea]MDN3518692.1 glutamine amidotransferase [Aquisalimonas lutea]
MTATRPSCVAFRHVAFEGLGLLEPLLAERGFRVRYLDAGVDDLGAVDPLAPDLLVVLGGPIGADDDADYPFLTDEIRVLAARLAADRPTLGLCLGAQLMARALGARIYPAAGKEIGWAGIRLTGAGRDSCLRHLDGDETAVLHWHGDTFDLPDGAEHLAATDVCPNQAFRYGRNALALQFHAEAAGASLERWFIGHTGEIAATPGVTVPRLRADTARWSGPLTERGRRCFSEWLSTVIPDTDPVS